MPNYDSGPITNHPVVSHDRWLAARVTLLEREKEFSKLRDQIARQRRELPWERVDKTYVFDTPNGKETLADLFEGRRQLIVYHFMLAPEADGVALQGGVVRRERLQLRLFRVVQA